MQAGHRMVNGGSMDENGRSRTIKEPHMFDSLRRSRVPVDTDRLKSQAAEVGAALSEASIRAGHAAEHLAHQTKDAAYQAKDWATPRVERAWNEGRRVAGPKIEEAVETAAEKALPLVDKTHDRLVEEVLPKFVAALSAAAAAAAVGADKARDVANARLTELAHVEVPVPPKKSHTGAKIFWWLTGIAVVGAVIAAIRRNQPTSDPWAEEPWEDAEVEAKHGGVRDTLAHAADAVGEVAGEAVATARGTGEMLAEKARSLTDKDEAAAEPTAGEPTAAAVEITPEATAPADEAAKPAPRRSTRKPATPKDVAPEQDAGTANS